MKKTIFAMMLLGFGLQANAYVQDDALYSTVTIPTASPISTVQPVVIERTEIIPEEEVIIIEDTEKAKTKLKKSNKEEKRKSSEIEGNIYYPIMDMLGKYKNEIKIVYTDIDGILLPENQKSTIFRESIYKSIKKLKENNIPVIFTTGRTYREAKRVAEALELTPEYYITLNGAEIVTSDGHVIYKKSLNRKNVFDISEEVKWFNYHYKQGLKMAYYGKGKVYVRRYSNIPDLVDVPVIIDKFLDLPKTVRIAKIRIYAQDAHTLELFKKYLDTNYKLSLNVKEISPNFIDINIKNATKANAVKYLSKITGIELKNSAGFGFTQPDVGLMMLLRENGGLAISNDDSLYQVKDASSYITKNVENDGFTFAIDTILGNNLILNAEKE